MFESNFSDLPVDYTNQFKSGEVVKIRYLKVEMSFLIKKNPHHDKIINQMFQKLAKNIQITSSN